MWVKKKTGKNKAKKQFILLVCFVMLAVFTAAVRVSAPSEAQKVPYTMALHVQAEEQAQADAIGSASQMKDGAILHAWCWSFNTIKQNMKAIAEAGYTSIQTSPVEDCVVGNGGNLKFTNQWWYHYQPTDYKIGNYQLGTEAEFAAMCKEAHKYGVRIIADVVVNHCTGDYSKISDHIKNIPNFFHTNIQISDWNNRWQVTQQSLLGLWDVNTQNTNVQNYIKKFLLRLVELGADGFRYDAAKHVELPDDGNYGGNFWPNILNNGSEFQYGEILQDSISRESDYAKYMSVTASSYGKKLRDHIGSNDLSAGMVMSYDINVDSDKIVTWVESHDNYANNITDWGSSQWMTDEQIKLLWGVIASRQGGTPMFFSRPAGGGGKSWDNRFPELTKIGDRGSSLFMDDEIAAVNKFRNAMGDGEAEYLRNPNSNQSILMIERGKKGVVIVNALSSAYTLNSVTNLADGSYENQTDDNSLFEVEHGVIKGTLPARSIVVLMEPVIHNKPDVRIENEVTSFRTDTYTLTLKATNTVNATCQINSRPSYSYRDKDTVMIGEGDAYGTVYRIELRGVNEAGITVSKSYTITKKDPKAGIIIYFEKPGTWGNNINAYIYEENGTTVKQLAAWPGVPMNKLGEGRYSYLMEEEYKNPLIIFNDGTNQSPGVNKTGFVMKDGTTYTINGPKESLDKPNPPMAPAVNTVTATQVMLEEIKGAEYRAGNGTWQNSPVFSGLTPLTTYVFYARYAQTQTAEASEPSTGTTVTTLQADTSNKVTIYYYTSWTNAKIHYQIGSGSWTAVPGIAMDTSSVKGYKIATIDLGKEKTLTACFNDGSGSWDNNNGQDYKFNNPGTYTVKNGAITVGKP